MLPTSCLLLPRQLVTSCPPPPCAGVEPGGRAAGGREGWRAAGGREGGRAGHHSGSVSQVPPSGPPPQSPLPSRRPPHLCRHCALVVLFSSCPLLHGCHSWLRRWGGSSAQQDVRGCPPSAPDTRLVRLSCGSVSVTAVMGPSGLRGCREPTSASHPQPHKLGRS